MVKLLSAHGISLILLNISLVAAFIGIFFFTFGSYIEKLVLRRQIKFIMDDFVGSLKFVAPDEVWQQLGQATATLPEADTSHDQDTEDNNQALLKEALSIFGVLLVVSLFAVGLLWYLSGKTFNLGRLFGESFLLLGFVAVVELLFYSLVAANYKSVDPNFIKGVMVKNLRDYVKT